MTPDELKAIKARCEAATTQTPPCKHPGCHAHRSHPCEECGRQGGYASQTQLIAIICQDLPDCIAEIERLQALVKTAHREGFAAIEGFAAYDADDYLWKNSEARKALESKQ